MEADNQCKFKKVLKLLELHAFLGGLVFYAPVALLIRTQRGITIPQFFILEAILFSSIFLGEIPAGWVTDRIGYKKSLFLASIVLFLSRVVLIFAGNFPAFLLEAILEGISSCFVSGTQEAYMYSFWSKEDYTVKLGKISNYGTAGFMLSTISYMFLMHWFGLTGLIVATSIASAFAIAAAASLPPEPHHTHSESVSILPLREVLHRVKQILKTSSMFYIVGNSLLAISMLVTNFFYIIKVTRAGLPEETMTAVILGYSFVSLLCPTIVKHFQQIHYQHTILIYLAGGAAFFLGLFFSDGWVAVALMILGPLVLDIPAFLLSELMNENVDERNLGDSRATVLSVYSLGCDALEIIFLFISAAVSGQEGNTAFLIVAVAYILVTILFTLDFRKHGDETGENADNIQ